MVEFQLAKIQQQIPTFFTVIDNAIQGIYRKTEIETREIRNDPLVGTRVGFLLHPTVEHEIKTSLEQANLCDVQLKTVFNSPGVCHLELITPFAMLMISRVHRNGDVPRKTKYRQKFVDQTFLREVYPELSLFNEECIPLYIITHTPNPNDSSEAIVRIGRLSVNQDSWSCNYYLKDIISLTPNTEEIKEDSKIALGEEVKRESHIKIKKKK